MMESSRHRFGPFQLLYPLGAGGMGEVFLARQQGEHGIQRLVAVKRMLVQHARRPQLVSLFLDEVRIAAQLNHGNIVQVIDHGAIDGRYFMAMEYVHGENLLEVIHRLEERDEPMPLDFALHIGSCVCQGLSYAHGKRSMDGRPLGIVHRDISPQNILVAFGGEVKIADFGVARAAEQTHQTVGGELKGKLAYMSPEQAYGRSLDHRSDLFSLGVVLYEVLCGRSPFLRDNPMATLEAVRGAEQVVSLSALRPELPPEVVELVHQALSPAPADRPDSARSMHEALQRTMRLHGMSVSAYDLSDFVSELFPESRPRSEEDHDAPGGTAVGRRADGREQDLERRTLFYLRRRHPEVQPLAEPAPQDHGAASETAAAARGIRRGRGLYALAAAAIGVLAVVVGVGVLRGGRPARVPGTAAAEPDVGPRPAPADAAVSPAPIDQGARELSASAWLEVRSRPAGAWVALGGQRLAARTPLSRRLPPGRHRCAVGLAGHATHRQPVVLREGARTRVSVTLRPLPARVTVTSTHACRVRVNGHLVGPAPLRRHVVPAGPTTIVCTDPASGVADRRQVRAAPGATASVSFRFGVLAINLQPWARVRVDGHPRGTTPLRLVLPAGEHRVELANPDRGLQSRRRVEIGAGQTLRISSW